jgi:hypothetical protein
MDTNDHLNELMEQGLASYAAEPSADLASRILMEAQATPVPMSSRWYMGLAGWGIGLTAAAGFLAFSLMHSGMKGPAQKQLAAHTIPPSAANTHPPVRNAAIARSPRHRSPEMVPRMANAVYVAPPVTEQERLLLTLAANHPKQALELVAMEERETEPLKVEPLTATPLKIELMARAPLDVTPLHIEPLAEPSSE